MERGLRPGERAKPSGHGRLIYKWSVGCTRGSGQSPAVTEDKSIYGAVCAGKEETMYKINDAKMFFDMADGQAVVINFTNGMYYGTSTLGSAVLSNLVNGVAPEKIAEAVRAHAGCPAGFDAAFAAFLDELTGKEILVSGPAADAAAEIPESAFADGFELTLDEFAEVQDLLLADPVHDVDVDQGWPVLGDE